MEPVMGTLSFQLLALQLMRAQMLNVGFRPWTSLVIQRRADRLANMFNQYNPSMVRAFSVSSTGFHV